MVPTRRLAVVTLCVGVALFFFPGTIAGGLWWPWIAVNAVLLVIAVLDALASPRITALSIERSLAPVVVMGATAPIAWTLTNRGSRSIHLELADSLSPSLYPKARRVGGRVAPNSTLTLTTTITPSRRGRFPISEIALRVKGPLGLMYRERTRQVPALLRVHPPFRSKDEAELRIRKTRILEVGQRSVRGHGGGTDFDQLRDYTPDDQFRHVDWAASARVGRPIVRTFRPERNQNVLVLIDNGRLMAARVEGVPRLEHAMDAAVMLTAVATHLGDRVGLVTFDQKVATMVVPDRRHDQVTRMTEAMYDLRPVLAESDYGEVFRFTLARFRRRSLLVLLTDLATQTMQDSLVPALGLLMRRHIVLIGAVRDPAVVRWSQTEADDVESLYRRGAALEALDERRRLVARLRSMGATVVDAAPGGLSPQLADVYLKMKSTGRL